MAFHLSPRSEIECVCACPCLLHGEERARKLGFVQPGKFNLWDSHSQKSAQAVPFFSLMHPDGLPTSRICWVIASVSTWLHLSSRIVSKWIWAPSWGPQQVYLWKWTCLQTWSCLCVHHLWANSWKVSWVNQVAGLHGAFCMTRILIFNPQKVLILILKTILWGRTTIPILQMRIPSPRERESHFPWVIQQQVGEAGWESWVFWVRGN